MNNTIQPGEKNKTLVIQALEMLSLSQLHKELGKEEGDPTEEADFLKKCFEKAGIPVPKYKSFMAKKNFFNFNKGDILTFRLINTPILKDLGIYLIGIGESLYITYYSEEKKAFVIDDSKAIPKGKATIEGILARVEEGGANE